MFNLGDFFTLVLSDLSFHASSISLFFHLCSHVIFCVFVLALRYFIHVCSICLMPGSCHPIFVLMNWITSIIYLLLLAIHICFAYESASMIRILPTYTFYQLSEQQWLKALSIWVCLCMFWVSEFWLSHPNWSILPIIKKY